MPDNPSQLPWHEMEEGPCELRMQAEVYTSLAQMISAPSVLLYYSRLKLSVRHDVMFTDLLSVV